MPTVPTGRSREPPRRKLPPLIVLDGSPEGLLANHRRNLDAAVTETRQKMYSIREELEK